MVSDNVITTLGQRLTLGLTVDPASTPDNVILWAAHSSPSDNNGTPNSGVVTRLSGPGFTTRQDVITGLPRAIANHATNAVHFGLRREALYRAGRQHRRGRHQQRGRRVRQRAGAAAFGGPARRGRARGRVRRLVPEHHEHVRPAALRRRPRTPPACGTRTTSPSTPTGSSTGATTGSAPQVTTRQAPRRRATDWGARTRISRAAITQASRTTTLNLLRPGRRTRTVTPTRTATSASSATATGRECRRCRTTRRRCTTSTLTGRPTASSSTAATPSAEH